MSASGRQYSLKDVTKVSHGDNRIVANAVLTPSLLHYTQDILLPFFVKTINT